MKEIETEVIKDKDKTKTRTFFVREALAALIAIVSLLALLLAILWPFGMIWSLNTLFSLKIPYTFWTWLACSWLILSLQGALGISKVKIKDKQNGK